MIKDVHDMCDDLAGLIRDHLHALRELQFARGYRAGFRDGSKAETGEQFDMQALQERAKYTGESMWNYLDKIPQQEDIRRTLLRVMGMEEN